MAITRWQPFQDIERWEPMREMESLQRQINRLFDRLMPTTNGESSGIAFIPAAEMEETAERLILKLEIPGMTAKDLDVKVTEESISIAGEKKSETKTEEKGMVRSEFRYGKFERVIDLPVRVQSDKAKAEYKNGILELTLPKTEREKRKTVKVEVV